RPDRVRRSPPDHGVRLSRRADAEAAGHRPGRRSHRTRTQMTTVQQTVEQTYREQAGRVLATLIRQLGDFGLAEDALQEAFESALGAWQARGIPSDPAAWIITT